MLDRFVFALFIFYLMSLLSLRLQRIEFFFYCFGIQKLTFDMLMVLHLHLLTLLVISYLKVYNLLSIDNIFFYFLPVCTFILLWHLMTLDSYFLPEHGIHFKNAADGADGFVPDVDFRPGGVGDRNHFPYSSF